MKKVTLFVFVISFLAANGLLAQNGRQIRWMPERVSSVIGNGQGSAEPLEVTFTSAVSLPEVSLEVVPELQPFVAVAPASIGPLEAGVPVAVSLTFRLPPAVVEGVYEGVVLVRDRRRVVAAPLPVKVEVDFGDNRVPSFTKVASDETLAAIVDVSESFGTVVFADWTADLRSWDPGDIVVFPASEAFPDGALRQIQSIVPGNGIIVLTSVLAPLEDAFEDASIHINRAMNTEDLEPNSDLFAAHSPLRLRSLSSEAPLSERFEVDVDAVLFDLDGDLDSTDDQIAATGMLTFAASLSLDLEIDDFEVTEVSFISTLEEEASLSGTSSIELLAIEKKFPVGKPLRFKPIIVWAGWVPVVFTPELSLFVGVDGSVNIGIEATVSQQAAVEAGILYSNGVWQPVHDFTNSIDFQTPTATLNTLFKGFTGPELSLLVYGVVGPKVEAFGFLQFDVNTTRCPDWWKLEGGFEVNAGFKVLGFGRRVLTDVTFDGLIFEVFPLASANACPVSPILYEEDFSEGVFPDNLVHIGGPVSVAPFGANNALLLGSGGCVELPWRFSRELQDLVFEADIIITWAGAGDFHVNTFYDALEATNVDCRPLTDGYRSGVFPPVSDNPVDTLSRRLGGVWTPLDSQTGIITTNQQFHFEYLMKSDGSLQIRIDDHVALSAEDASHLNGPISLRGWGDVWIDNIRVTALHAN